MAIDAGIYQMVGRGVKSVADYQGEYAQQAQNKLLAETQGLKLDEYKRGVQAETQMNSLYQQALGPNGQIDRTKLLTGAAGAGLGSRIPGLQKDWAAADKATGEVDAQRFKLASDRYAVSQKTFGALMNMPNLSKDAVLAAGQQMVEQGIITPELFAKLPASLPDDPNQLRQDLRTRLSTQLTPEQIMTVFAPKAEKIDNGQTIGFKDMNPNSPTYGQETGGAAVQKQATPEAVMTDARTRAEGAANRGVTMRGQNLADQRSRESTAATMSKPFEITGEDGKPVLVQQDKQGNIKKVDGYAPKIGKSDLGTEGERNAAGYGQRMTAAEKLITDISAKDPKSQKPGLVEQAAGGTGMVANLSRSSTRQEYRQAQEDWVRAKLRKESGAVIGDEEMAREITVYFPQIGDKDDVIKQKAAARKTAESAMKQAAGRAYKEPAAGPNIDALLDKYK
jgi:hypothetical protein